MAEKSTLNKLKTQERELRRNLIMDAAEKVFSTQPFNKVSMREIADEAGIATSSIYTYFPNQESLFVETTLREANVLINELNGIIQAEKDHAINVEKVISSFIDYISSHDSYFRMMVVFMTHGNLTPDSLEKLNSTMRKALDMFDALFKEIQFQGNVRMMSHFFFAALNGILVTFRKLPGRTEEEVLAHMKDVGNLFKAMILAMSGDNQSDNETK
ncbi:MAG: TetR/AcrR family transcriptional regulator [bacterium]|nr:TetR/AcrR family transcriptional regulator [bacterium]